MCWLKFLSFPKSQIPTWATRQVTNIVAMVNSAQTSGSHGTTNVITCKAAIQALTCQRA